MGEGKEGRFGDALRPALARLRRSTAYGVLGLAAIAIAGCGNYFSSGPLYREAYLECMESLPPGPARTSYNDWDEVVSQCRLYANDVAERTAQSAPPSKEHNNGE